MAKVLEALIAKGRRAKRPQEQKEIAFGLADLSTHGKLISAGCSSSAVISVFVGLLGSKHILYCVLQSYCRMALFYSLL